jgi:hypothetical protein
MAIQDDVPIYSRRTFERKPRDDIFGGPGAWDNAQKARVPCAKDECLGDQAAFFQVQIRSADEPMTTFYRVRSERGWWWWWWWWGGGGALTTTPAAAGVVHDVRPPVAGELSAEGRRRCFRSPLPLEAVEGGRLWGLAVRFGSGVVGGVRRL